MITKKPHPIAVSCSDIHLSATAPIARSKEKDWIAKQESYIQQWAALKQKYNVPAIIAGDIFDKAKGTPELINLATKYLKGDYVIPGQHDLPYHDFDQMHKSAFGVLVETGVVRLIPPAREGKGWQVSDKLCLHAFPWGFEICPPDKEVCQNGTHVAVIHAYCWHKGQAYVGADKGQNAVAYRKQIRGYDFALFGDNHKKFTLKSGDCTVVNHGGFMRCK
jgi:hypothetical protein